MSKVNNTFPLTKREYPAIGFVVVLFALVAFVIYGGWALVPISYGKVSATSKQKGE